VSTVLDTPSNAPSHPVLPDLFEVVNGEIVELPNMSFYACLVANRLNLEMGIHLKTNDVGQSGVELLYRLPSTEDETLSRRPDVSYVSYERWPRTRPIPARGNALEVVPDLAAEVVSPTDSAEELNKKVLEYLNAGVRLVWVVYPLSREVHSFRPGAGESQIFRAGAALNAGDLLPGFRTPVLDLFPPVERSPVEDDV
jgi:Uma2 family endonuclease